VPKVTQEHLDRRRQEILDGARRCFARFGYEGATVRRLEREVGLSRGAIFNYFPSKWELFLATVRQEVDRSPDSWADGGFEELVRSTLEEDPSWLGVHLELARRFRTVPDLREELSRRLPSRREMVLKSLEDGQRAGEFRDDVPVETLRTFLALLLDGIVLQASLGVEIDIDAVLKLVDDAVRPRRRAAVARPGGRRTHFAP
jgi:TetR/AcrR family transcriptional regulator, transcriptional repressor of aconitase